METSNKGTGCDLYKRTAYGNNSALLFHSSSILPPRTMNYCLDESYSRNGEAISVRNRRNRLSLAVAG